MNCNECLEEIYSLPVERMNSIPSTVMAHISTCKPCQKAFQGYQNILDTVSHTHQIKAPADFRENMMRKILESESELASPSLKVARPWKRKTRWLAAAALIGVMLLIIPFMGKRDELSGNARAAETIFLNAIDAT
ncbi:MAG: hypothetical protein KGM98_13865, partial [Bacteroidota bacterium]|nr:hypothetical protein [Bacteroidota bacterium]